MFIDADFYGGGIHQGKAGSFLDMHADFNYHPLKEHWFRNLNLLLYLNKDWKKEYAGELIRNDQECEARETRYLAEGWTWIFKVNRAWSRDANIGGNIARFINHSCKPNCSFEVVDKTIWIKAARMIRRGEELTYNYSIIGERTIPCRCRPGCPNKI